MSKTEPFDLGILNFKEYIENPATISSVSEDQFKEIVDMCRHAIHRVRPGNRSGALPILSMFLWYGRNRSPRISINVEELLADAFRVAIDHRFSPSALVYASFNTGFKSGGFNNFVTSSEGVEVEPEETVSWEAGAKGRWLGGALSYGGTFFHMDVDDLQLQDAGQWDVENGIIFEHRSLATQPIAAATGVNCLTHPLQLSYNLRFGSFN